MLLGHFAVVVVVVVVVVDDEVDTFVVDAVVGVCCCCWCFVGFVLAAVDAVDGEDATVDVYFVVVGVDAGFVGFV